MNRIPASLESINLLYANMGNNFKMFTPLLCSFVDVYEKLELIDNVKFPTEDLLLCKELIKLNISLLLISMDLSTFLRANFKSASPTEKRFNLKYVNVITYEGFNYFFGLRNNKENALWSLLMKEAKQIDNKVLNDDILKVTACADEFENKYLQSSDLNSRNLSVHYDKNPILVYYDIVKLNEEDETKRAIAFLAILESLSFFIRKYFKQNEETLSKHLKSQEPYDLSIREIINSFQDKTGKLSTTLNDKIISFGQCLDKIISSCNKQKFIADKLELKDDFSNLFNSIIESIYPGLHLHFIYLDLACTIKAYLNSEYYFEKQMNLRRIRIVLYEGFKKIYGFTSNQEINSFWRKNIYNILYNSSDFTITSKLTTTENNLKQLREYSDLKDDKKRECSVHYRYKKSDNIIPIFHQLIDSNPIIEMDKALHMLNLLPTIIELNEISFQEVYKSVSDNISLSNSKTRETIDNIISMIEESKIEDKNKQLAIEQIKKIEEMYLSFLKI
jgi:hypothetical protein